MTSLPSKSHPGADGGAEFNRIRARRRASQVKVLKAKAERGETDGTERALVRMGPANTRIITGQDDLSEWDDEELRRGQRRDKNGRFQGKDPVVVPKALHDELVRRTLIQANDIMRDNLGEAVCMLVALAKSPGVEAKDRLRAISMIMDRVMGKSPDKVEISGQSPWLVALQGGIVTVNGENSNGATVLEEDDVDDADFVDE